MSSPQVPARIAALRKAMAQANLQAWIIPATDPHQSEYFSPHWQAREYFSGFSGSAGTLVVTAQAAGLWTDSRYYLQAEQQLPHGVVSLFKSQEAGVPTFIKWLAEVLPCGAKVGMDGWLLSAKEKIGRKAELAAQFMELDLNHDISAQAWESRPALPTGSVFEHPMHLAGQSRVEKLNALRDLMAQKGCDHHLVVPLDDIAWLLNLRGNDVPHNPVFYAYLLISPKSATLFIEESKLSPAIVASLQADGLGILPYAKVQEQLQTLAGRILIDDNNTACNVVAALPGSVYAVYGTTLSIALKARKNPVEIAHLRATMAKDGVALLRLFRWIEANIHLGITELQVSDKLVELHSAKARYYGESFPAIAGYGANGAIVHYRPGHDSATLSPKGIFLLDSGAQYEDGTTDITRTVALGEVTLEQKRNFTLVLKGHIALAMAKFPEGTGGYQLDVYARMALWQHGLNFGHGTGHGVGFFLSVHEGPQSIRNGYNERSAIPLAPGMVTSNEPGYYEPGQYGIRIENLVLCVEAETTAYGRFLSFETLSLFPIDLKLVEVALLTLTEIQWLDNYHTMVLERLGPLLNADELEWLAARCKAC